MNDVAVKEKGRCEVFLQDYKKAYDMSALKEKIPIIIFYPCRYPDSYFAACTGKRASPSLNG
jgi:hypothetical protein